MIQAVPFIRIGQMITGQRRCRIQFPDRFFIPVHMFHLQQYTVISQFQRTVKQIFKISAGVGFIQLRDIIGRSGAGDIRSVTAL